MITENEYLTDFLAGAILILAIFPIAKDFWSNPFDKLFWCSFITSAGLASVLVMIGVYLYKNQSKK